MTDTITRAAARHLIVELDDKLFIPPKLFRALYTGIDGLPPAPPGWIPIEEKVPEVDDSGWSKYVLVSASNYTVPTIGMYHQELDGSGAFYFADRDDMKPLSAYGVIVNAWMPLPKNYEHEEEKD